MFKKLLALLPAVGLFGCASTSTVVPPPMEVRVERVKVALVEVDPTILARCRRPAKLSETIPGILEGRVREKDVVAALASSYANEVACYLAKEEALRAQRALREEVIKANQNVQE